MMNVGAPIRPMDLDHPEELRFLKQVGVDCVEITLEICPGYKETGGQLSREGLEQVVEALDRTGLKVGRANVLRDYLKATYLNQPGWEREIENLVHNIALCKEYELSLLAIGAFKASLFSDAIKDERRWVEGRGGYLYRRMDLSGALDRPPPSGAPTHEELWERTLKIYRAVLHEAERVGVKIAMHGNDPPVPSLCGVPQILYNYAAFDRLFSEVPSPNSGMTFCVGTRYESGEDVFEGIRRFGKQNKIFYVHFRNIRGTIPKTRGYEEVTLDTGDLNMYRVARTLQEVRYEGVIDYDHPLRLINDEYPWRAYTAYCVGYIRSILQALENGG